MCTYFVCYCSEEQIRITLHRGRAPFFGMQTKRMMNTRHQLAAAKKKRILRSVRICDKVFSGIQFRWNKAAPRPRELAVLCTEKEAPHCLSSTLSMEIIFQILHNFGCVICFLPSKNCLSTEMENTSYKLSSSNSLRFVLVS